MEPVLAGPGTPSCGADSERPPDVTVWVELLDAAALLLPVLLALLLVPDAVPAELLLLEVASALLLLDVSATCR